MQFMHECIPADIVRLGSEVGCTDVDRNDFPGVVLAQIVFNLCRADRAGAIEENLNGKSECIWFIGQ